MSRRSRLAPARRRLAAGLAPLVLCAASLAQEPTFAPGFEAVKAAGTFAAATDLAFLPDGRMLIAEKAGRVRLHDGVAAQPTPLIDLATEVNNVGDRGLLGLAPHPGFVADGGATSWIYLLYTVSPVPGQDLAYDENDQYSFSRLTRYRTSESGGELVALPASRQVLIGNPLPDGTVPDGIASLRDLHSNGALVFGEDGSLLFSTGDGATAAFVDTGGIDVPGFEQFVHPTTGLRGPMPQEQDSGAFRSQDLRSLAGKVLRVDPETGLGYPSNPFFDGDPASNRSKVWALGLRNPFRMGLRPGSGASDPSLGQPGTLFVGDVGWFKWEELHVASGGENLGWPCVDGYLLNPDAQTFDASSHPYGIPDCKQTPAGLIVPPILAWHHVEPSLVTPLGVHVDSEGAPAPGFTGTCSIGGEQYVGGDYPDEYDGVFFFADYASQWIRVLVLAPGDLVVEVRDFATDVGAVVDLERHPLTGDIHYLDIDAGEVFRIRAGVNQSPVAVLQATPSSGDPPLAVSFDGSASSDPDDEPLTYRWTFGDGAPPQTGVTVQHTYAGVGVYEAGLTVTDPGGLVSSASTLITVGDPPPAVRIVSPLPGATFDPPEDVALSGQVLGQTTGELTYQWTVDLFHDQHAHPSTFVSSLADDVLDADLHGNEGELYYYRATFEAFEDGDLLGSDRVYLYPSEHLFDPTGTALPIARLFELDPPLPEGSGNPDVEVIRDGDLPPEDLQDPSRQLDTFHSGDQGDDDWLGFELVQPSGSADRFVGLVFQEGLHFADGGWWEDFTVEVRQGGAWLPVSGLVTVPPYPFHLAADPSFDGYGFQTYEIGFDPVAGDAIRLRGDPGGSAGYVSCAELRVRVARELPPQGAYEDLTAGGAFLGAVFELAPPHPTGAGNPDPEVLRNGTFPPLGSPSAFGQFDTEHGGDQGGHDWLGYGFDELRTFARVVLQEGRHVPEGGWFEDVSIEVRSGDGEAWVPVAATSSPPHTGASDAASGYATYTFDFEPTLGRQVRVAGSPGGTVGFVSAGELRVHGPALGAGCGVVLYGTELEENGRLVLDSHTPPVLGSPFALEVSLDFAGPSGAVPAWISLAGGSASLPFLGGVLLLDPLQLWSTQPVALDAEGEGVLLLDLPDAPPLSGTPAFAQAIAFDPVPDASFAFSNGVMATLCTW